MSGEQPSIALVFFRTAADVEVVRNWLKGLPEEERREVGRDLMRVQYRWPIGMPLVRPLGAGLWEVRTDLPTGRTSRVLFGVVEGRLLAVHAFIKKTRATPDADLKLARK